MALLADSTSEWRKRRAGPRSVELADHRPSAGRRTREELETVVRFDLAGPLADLWTADLGQARRWKARGYPVAAVSGGWRCAVPKRALTFRVLNAALLAEVDEAAHESPSENGSATAGVENCEGCGVDATGEAGRNTAAGVRLCAACYRETPTEDDPGIEGPCDPAVEAAVDEAFEGLAACPSCGEPVVFDGDDFECRSCGAGSVRMAIPVEDDDEELARMMAEEAAGS